MMTMLVLAAAVVWLAWSNGANDNFKGVATIYGSDTTSFRGALIWATVTTVAGSLLSVFLADVLLERFSGAGIIPTDQIDATWLVAVGAAAAVTIALATVLGMPTSTTHALVGALVGAGVIAQPGAVQWASAWSKFAQPLLLSPLAAVGAAAVLYLILRRIRTGLGVERETCVCVGDAEPEPAVIQEDGTAVLTASDSSGRVIDIDEVEQCIERYRGQFMGVHAQSMVDRLHYVSGGAVCFARAVNDTPKIAALLLSAELLSGSAITAGGLSLVAVAMAAGGLLQSRRVAQTMSKDITDLNCGQGLTANLVTSGLVLVASHLGMPVSTTHVSCGSIFGIGVANRGIRWRTLTEILTTWVLTLPLAAALGALVYWLLALL